MDITCLKVGDSFFDDDGNKWTVISTPEDIAPESENDVLANHIVVIPEDLNKEPFALYALGSNISRAEAIKRASLDRFNTGLTTLMVVLALIAKEGGAVATMDTLSLSLEAIASVINSAILSHFC